MKRLPVVILAFWVLLVTVVAGCGRTPRYDGRLVAADSLMRSAPDSALAIVEDVCRDSLAAEGDRAYRDLLLTQARYRCYVTATSDSDITRALAYYRAHPSEREKLTRTYIYKGAVMEELGHPDSAMLYYKHGEATADTTDYYNLGQINTRIADLYRLYYGDKQVCFMRFKTALEYHKKAGNRRLQQNCYLNMAGCLGVTGMGNPNGYFKKSLQMAYELRDTFLIVESLELYLRYLSLIDSTRSQAKRIALDCVDKYPNHVTPDLLLDLAYIYACDEAKDTAAYYLGIVDNAQQADNLSHTKSRSHSIHAILAKNEGDLAQAEYHISMNNQVEDSLVDNRYRYYFQQLEDDANQQRAATAKREINYLTLALCLLALLSVIVFSMLMLIAMRRRNRTKSIMQELAKHACNYESLSARIDEKNSVIENLVKNMVAFMQASIETSEKDSPSVIRKIIRKSILDIADEDFWDGLSHYLDKSHDNLVSRIKNKYHNLGDKDIKFIELSCCGFNYIEIAIILDYSPQYISQKRKEIAKKMKLTIPLQDYLKKCIEKSSYGMVN